MRRFCGPLSTRARGEGMQSDGRPIIIDSAEEYLASATKQTTGGHVWDAAKVLLDYLHAHPDALNGESSDRIHKGCRILELGAGTGFLSMHIARDFRASEIVATEMVEGGALRWLVQNVQRNREAGHAFSTLSTAPLDWNWVINIGTSDGSDQTSTAATHAPLNSGPHVAGSFAEREAGTSIMSTEWDVIVGSDLVYDDAGVYMLPRVLRRLLAAGSKAFALYAHTLNRFEFADHDFFAELTALGLSFTQVFPGQVEEAEGFSGELFPEMRVVIMRISIANTSDATDGTQ